MAVSELKLPPLRARVRDSARRAGLPVFWAWWMRELDAVVPAAPRAALARRRMRPVIAFGADEATLWRPAMDNGRAVMTAAATIPLAGDAGEIAAAGRAAMAPLARMVYGGPSTSARVVVCLPPREVLRKKLVLPAAVEENFRQALAYDLDRHTPFKSDELYFDAAIVDRNAARNTITVDLATARRAVVDPVLRHVAAWGATVAAVVADLPSAAATSRLNLLPVELRPSRSVWRRWQFWLPLTLLAVMAAAAVAIPLWQKRDYVQQLGALTDQARMSAAVSETLRTELNTRVADYNYALERKYTFPSALALIDAVAKLLPDDTWLTQFELKSVAKGKDTQRDVTVRGETANAGRLVQLFEESHLFAQAGQRGPTTKIQPGPGEIFDLGAQVKPRALPPQVTLVVADPNAAPPAPAVPGATSPAIDASTPVMPPPSGMAPSPATPTPATPTPATPTPATPTPATPTPATPSSGGSAPANDAMKSPANGSARK